MTKLFVVAAFATVFIASGIESQAQLNLYFAPIDCREHAESSDGIPETPEIAVTIDSSLISPDIYADEQLSLEAWKQWTVVDNFSFGKDRGALSMIADMNALHPFFRDKVNELIIRCKKQGIELAIVETYRTHAKQNEYRSMGRKYTNSTGGKSKHQYGLAVDVVPMVNGVAVWDNVWLWKKVGVAGEKLGLRWGGRWKKPYDPGHFEWTGGLNSTHLSAGRLPAIPREKYPCIEEDILNLRNYWSQWERLQQEVLSGKRRETNVSAN
jgi:hypothetical protein